MVTLSDAPVTTDTVDPDGIGDDIAAGTAKARSIDWTLDTRCLVG